MARYRSTPTRTRFVVTRAPKPRARTDAQIEANRRAFDAAPAYIEARGLAKGALVIDHRGNPWKVVSRGIRYHEDVTTALYGVSPARAPKELAATNRLREIISIVLRDGTHTPQSRRSTPDHVRADFPVAEQEALWRDGRLDSMASFPHLALCAGDILCAVRPNYDDSPEEAWTKDPKLARGARAAIAISPRPYTLPEFSVRVRASKDDTGA